MKNIPKKTTKYPNQSGMAPSSRETGTKKLLKQLPIQDPGRPWGGDDDEADYAGGVKTFNRGANHYGKDNVEFDVDKKGDLKAGIAINAEETEDKDGKKASAKREKKFDKWARSKGYDTNYNEEADKDDDKKSDKKLPPWLKKKDGDKDSDKDNDKKSSDKKDDGKKGGKTLVCKEVDEERLTELSQALLARAAAKADKKANDANKEYNKRNRQWANFSVGAQRKEQGKPMSKMAKPRNEETEVDEEETKKPLKVLKKKKGESNFSHYWRNSASARYTAKDVKSSKDIKKEETVDEASWHLNPAKKGMWNGKSKAEISKAKTSAKKSGNVTREREANFALLAKNHWHKEETSLAEHLGKGASVKTYIDDFHKSDAPQFKGKSSEKKRKMAIAAWYASKGEETRAVEVLNTINEDKKKVSKEQKNYRFKHKLAVTQLYDTEALKKNEETLDELSRKTLNSYLSKSTAKSTQKNRQRARDRLAGTYQTKKDFYTKSKPYTAEETLVEARRSDLLRQFRKNEDDNYHTENGVLLAKHFGTKQEHAEALAAKRFRDHKGGYGMDSESQRHYNHITLMHDKYYSKLFEETVLKKKKLRAIADVPDIGATGKQD